jgi:hypothetical protein
MGCVERAYLANTGRVDGKDPELALTLFEAGCDVGEFVACRELGLAVRKNDLEGARSAYRRGCDLGDGESCALLDKLVKKYGG